MNIDRRRLIVNQDLICSETRRLIGGPIKSKGIEIWAAEIIATELPSNWPSGSRLTVPDIAIEIKVVLNNNVVGVWCLFFGLLADLNLGLSVKRLDAAHSVRRGHRNGLIFVPMINLQFVKVVVRLDGYRGTGLLELDGRCMDRHLVGCIRLELDERLLRRLSLLLVDLLCLATLVVDDDQLGLVRVELEELLRPLIRTRLTEILSILELLIRVPAIALHHEMRR